MPRDLGGIPTTRLRAGGPVDFYHFIRVEFPAPTGVLRLTDRWNGFVGNVDGSSQTWTEHPFRVGPLKQGRNSIMEVSWLEFVDVILYWRGLQKLHGVRNRPVEVYEGWWDSAGAYDGAWEMYRGRMDEGNFGPTSQITLRPTRTMERIVPSAVYDKYCPYVFGDPNTCAYGGSLALGCAHTRDACAGYANLVNFGGDDLIPAADAEVVFGSIVTSAPSVTSRPTSNYGADPVRPYVDIRSLL